MSAINAATSSQVQQSSGGGFRDLASEDFLQVIFTELANQDPLAPNDTQQLLDQIGTIRSIESDIQLTENLESIVRQSETAAASSYIGKYVTGLSEFGDRVENVVGSVSITEDGPILNLLDNNRVPIDRVEEIFDPLVFESIVNGG